MKTTRSDTSRMAIATAHDALPDGVSVKDRIKAIDAAYPFGARVGWPYKCWLKARKKYLDPYRGPKELTPLEKAIDANK